MLLLEVSNYALTIFVACATTLLPHPRFSVGNGFCKIPQNCSSTYYSSIYMYMCAIACMCMCRRLNTPLCMYVCANACMCILLHVYNMYVLCCCLYVYVQEVDERGCTVKERVEQACEETKGRIRQLESKIRSQSLVDTSLHTLEPASMIRQVPCVCACVCVCLYIIVEPPNNLDTLG